MPPSGFSRLAGKLAGPAGRTFRAVDPATGETLSPDFHRASPADLETACLAAHETAPAFAALPVKQRAAFLRDLAGRLLDAETRLVGRAMRETALDSARLKGELARTARQLTLFAEDLDEGSHADARIETGDRARKPTPKPDHRSMRRPLGPVAVFGASNFPFAYSVAGCDTASALAAGCPVIVKAHPAHPGVSALTGEIVAGAIAAGGLPAGVFSLLFDDGHEVGRALVSHPLVRAVAFTGSAKGGRAIMDLAAARPYPIPVYAEMGAANPVFLLPGALRLRGAEIASGLHASCTAGAGQFCTKPGLIVVRAGGDTDAFLDKFARLIRGTPPVPMLSPSIHANCIAGITGRSGDAGLRVLASGPGDAAGPYSAGPTVFVTDAAVFLSRPDLSEEIFGPTSLVVRCADEEEMLEVARRLAPALVAATHSESLESHYAGKLMALLGEKVGRIVHNGHTTGVEVSRAIVHGGPYPATSDGRTSSVGSTAIFRFTRRLCYQDCPDGMLPPELRDANPLGITRLVNGRRTAAPVDRRAD